jgi:hypothetical protein
MNGRSTTARYFVDSDASRQNRQHLGEVDGPRTTQGLPHLCGSSVCSWDLLRNKERKRPVTQLARSLATTCRNVFFRVPLSSTALYKLREGLMYLCIFAAWEDLAVHLHDDEGRSSSPQLPAPTAHH